MLKIIISYSIQVLLKRLFRSNSQKLALQRQDIFFILHHEVSEFVILGSFFLIIVKRKKKHESIEEIETLLSPMLQIIIQKIEKHLQVWTKLLLCLFCVLLSSSSVAKSRGDFCSFIKFSATFKSDEDAFSAGSSIGFCWHFVDWREPFDKVVLRRLHNSGSDSRRYRTKLSITTIQC